jgi:NDP-sugar pyrophosphorylase family protein
MKRAIILSAGFGERPRPLTNTIPKPLLPIHGKPIIAYIIERLKFFGILDIAINLHYLGNQIESYLGDGFRYGVRITYFYEPTILGTGGALWNAKRFFNNQSLLVVNGDTLSDVDIMAMIREHFNSKAIATMALSTVAPHDGFSCVITNNQNRVIGFENDLRPLPGNRYVFTGTHILDPVCFDFLPDGNSHIIDVFYKVALKKQLPIHAFLHNGYFYDIGTPKRYDDTCKEYLKGTGDDKSV